MDKLGVFYANQTSMCLTKHICVLMHILTKGEVGAVKPVSAFQ